MVLVLPLSRISAAGTGTVVGRHWDGRIAVLEIVRRIAVEEVVTVAAAAVVGIVVEIGAVVAGVVDGVIPAIAIVVEMDRTDIATIETVPLRGTFAAL